MLVNPQLEGTPFFWEGGSVGILLVHGFTATTAEVRPLAKVLHSIGYTVAGPLLPGHFSHPRDLNRVRWQDWVSEVDEMYHMMRTHCRDVILGGESTGALLSLYLAGVYKEPKALLLFAPAFRLKLSLLDYALLHILAPFIPWFSKKEANSNPLWQGYPVNPIKGILQLVRLQSRIRVILPKITQPALIVQGALDNTVHSSVPEYIHNHIRSEIKERSWMEKSSHCVLLDSEFDKVVTITLKFLDRVLHE